MARITHHTQTKSKQLVIVAGDKPAVRFIRIKEALSITSLSQTELYRRVKARTFPAQVKLAPGHVVWIEAEVLSWCEARIAESRAVA